jgi:hypothetical protein
MNNNTQSWQGFISRQSGIYEVILWYSRGFVERYTMTAFLPGMLATILSIDNRYTADILQSAKLMNTNKREKIKEQKLTRVFELTAKT